MKWIGSMAALALVVALGLGSSPSVGQAQPRSGAAAATEPEPLVQTRPRRVRPQIRVRPRCPYRSYHTPYPPAADCDYPGPNAKRACTVRYVQEFRPSGTVIVPRMRCWWVTG